MNKWQSYAITWAMFNVGSLILFLCEITSSDNLAASLVYSAGFGLALTLNRRFE